MLEKGFAKSRFIHYLEVVKIYFAASDAGSTVASWNTIGNTSVMCLASFLTVHGVSTFNDALSYVKTLKAKGGKPIPADENSLDALVDKKYAL